MKPDTDWSGTWPTLAMLRDFREWSIQRLMLGLQVAGIVAAVFLAGAAEAGGYKLIAWIQLGITFAAVMTRVEWLNASRNVRQERHH